MFLVPPNVNFGVEEETWESRTQKRRRAKGRFQRTGTKVKIDDRISKAGGARRYRCTKRITVWD